MKRALTIFGVLAVGTLAWWLLSPLVLETTVNDEFPVGIALEDRLLMEQIASLTPERIAAMPDAKREDLQAAMDALGARMPERSLTDSMPAAAAAVARGSFRDADAFHRGSGSATIYRQPDGAHVLRLENFSVTNGPALVVYLIRDITGDVSSGFVELGTLKGNKGNQNYDIPEDIDVSQFKSIVIWCKPFGVTFSIAELRG